MVTCNMDYLPFLTSTSELEAHFNNMFMMGAEQARITKGPKASDMFTHLWSAGEMDESNYVGRLTPDSITDDIVETQETNARPLPSLETAFSRHFVRFNDLNQGTEISGDLCTNNLDGYSYPENQCSSNDKDLEYTELFSRIGIEPPDENFDFDLRVLDNEKLDSGTENGDSNSLMEDLDALNCFDADEALMNLDACSIKNSDLGKTINQSSYTICLIITDEAGNY